MAESAADSTKSEDDSSEATDSKVSSSFNNSHSVYSSAQDASPNDNGHVSSSDARDPSQSVIQPSKFSGGSQVFWGVYSNPFVPRAPLRTDVVSTASSTGDERENIIAPSRLGAAVQRDSEERPSSYLRPSLLSAPKLGGQVFGSMGSLRQDSLSSISSSGNSFHIRPSVFSAPILKPAKLPDPTKTSEAKADSAGDSESSAQERACEASTASERLEGAEGGAGGSEVSSSSSASSTSSPHQTDVEGATAADASSYNHDIVADISKNNRLKDSSGVSSSSQSDFVFGKNLSQRVTGVISPSDNLGEASASSGFVFGESLSTRAVTEANGSSESSHKDDSDSDSGKLNRTLEESAREYQAKHENKTELKEVKRVTGEEEESNVLQANAKLFLFDATTQSWVERGRGVIRLNDMSSEDTRSFKSRLVMRTQGSLRVVLNTKIWPGMTIERASVKSVRITAMDTDEAIKIFLIMTNTKDSENLLRAIDWRIQQLKIQEESTRPYVDSRPGDKRKAESDFEFPNKSKKLCDPCESASFTLKKDESDSSVQDPETEASCESHSSSLTIKSESD
ncbi:hypothetical protein BsWGS_19533 [Bradybaena similaris]